MVVRGTETDIDIYKRTAALVGSKLTLKLRFQCAKFIALHVENALPETFKDGNIYSLEDQEVDIKDAPCLIKAFTNSSPTGDTSLVRAGIKPLTDNSRLMLKI